MNKLIRTSALLLATLAPLGIPLSAGAQTPPPIRPNQPARGNNQQQQQSPPQEELNEGIKFMQANAPHRLAVLQKLGGRAGANAQWTVVNQKKRFDMIKANNADSPEIYQARLREYQINDDIFDLCYQVRWASKPIAAIEPQLRAKVQELFDVGIQERQARIDRLEKQLARLKKEVDNDKAKRDELVAKNYQSIRKEGVPGAPLSNAVPSEPGLADRPPEVKH
ncbi:MAG TPA: hypothetical protein VH370_13310 [Humisphaera sp.]|jgi:hypothetical protein|nr:hypothetical protein [Humisphaera sp.]